MDKVRRQLHAFLASAALASAALLTTVISCGHNCTVPLTAVGCHIHTDLLCSQACIDNTRKLNLLLTNVKTHISCSDASLILQVLTSPHQPTNPLQVRSQPNASGTCCMACMPETFRCVVVVRSVFNSRTHKASMTCQGGCMQCTVAWKARDP